MRKENRKHNYVVGFSGGGQVAYGLGMGSENVEPMTLFQARKYVKKLFKAKRAKRVIYKLVPIETID